MKWNATDYVFRSKVGGSYVIASSVRQNIYMGELSQTYKSDLVKSVLIFFQQRKLIHGLTKSDLSAK